MLSRVAENLFWIARYMERAENIARLVDVARRMSALPRESGRPLSNEWSSILIAAGASDQLGETIERADAGLAIDHLLFDPANPSSVYNCITQARENARAVRFSITQEVWEALNSAWADFRALDRTSVRGGALANHIDWIKGQTALFHGTVMSTMLRDDGTAFLRLGSSIERTDSTARLLDVKYHVLLESADQVGSSVDHYQWLSLLQSAAAQRAYFFITKSDVSARGVARFLLLEQRFPRTVRFNVMQTVSTIGDLEAFYGQAAPCRAPAEALAQDLANQSIESVQAFGLHEFLTSIIERNYDIVSALAQSYGFAPIQAEDGTEHGGTALGQ